MFGVLKDALINIGTARISVWEVDASGQMADTGRVACIRGDILQSRKRLSPGTAVTAVKVSDDTYQLAQWAWEST